MNYDIFVKLPLAILAVCGASGSLAYLKAEETIRVLTYNIRYDNPGDKEDRWDNRKETVVQTILNADIAGLQEVLAGQQDYIQSQTPGWRWLGVARDDGLRRGEMSSIGWREEKLVAVEQGTFWLSPSPFQIGRAGWDAALPRIASWVRLVPRSAIQSGARRPEADESKSGPATLLLINTHFDHRGEEARRQSAALIRKWIAERRGDSQVLLIGDLNARVGSPPLDELLQSDLSEFPALIDARDQSEIADSGPNSTWNGFKDIVVGNRIDHILFQGDRIRIKDYQTLDPRTPHGNRFASDHLPVMAEISIR